MDRTHANFTGNTGTLDVRLKGANFIGPVTGTTFNAATHTDFSGLRPSISGIGGRVGTTAGEFDGVATINQVNGSQTNFGYNLNGAVSDFALENVSFGTAGTNITSLLANGTDLVLGLNGPNNASARVEVKDATGKTARFDATLTGALQNFTFSLTGSVLPVGFDLTKIMEINVVMDRTHANSTGNTGTLDVRLKGANFIGPVTGITFNAATHTDFSTLRPSISGIGGRVGTTAGESDGVATINQVNGSQTNFGYNLNGAVSDFALENVSFGTSGTNITSLLANGTDLVLGLNGPNNASVRVEVKDATGKTAKFDAALTGTLQNYVFSLTGSVLPVGFDLTKVMEINVVMDRTHANFTGNTGTLDVRLKGANFIGPVTGTAFNAATHTDFSALRPVISGLGGRVGTTAGESDGVATINQVSGSQTNFGYNLNGAPSDYALENVSFGTGGTNLTGLLANGTDLVLGLNGPNNASARIEVKDATGKTAQFDAALTGVLQNYTFSLTGSVLPVGFDLTKVMEINVVMDRTHANFTGNTGTLDVRLKGANFIGPVTGITFNAATHTDFSALRPVISGLGGRIGTTAGEFDGVATINQVSGSQTNFGYNLNGAPSDYALENIGFGTAGINITSLLANGTDLVLALNGPNNASARIEVKDATGKTAKFDAALTGVLQNYVFSLTGSVLPPGFDLTHVTQINVVMDRAHANFTGNTGTLDVRLKGADFVPVLSGAAFDASFHTQLSGVTQIQGTGSNVDPAKPLGIINFEQNSSTEFNYTYDVRPDAASFVFTQISLNPAGIALAPNFILAARGSENAKVRVEFKDINGKVARFILTLRPVDLNYTLSLTGDVLPPGFDLSKVVSISFVNDQNLAGFVKNDLVKITTKGLPFSPPIVPAALSAVKDTLIQNGLTFFQTAHGLDPNTHFPYDSVEANGLPDATAKFTQPTSIGFYLQILGDVVNGKINNGMSVDQALAEINTLLTNLVSIQGTNTAWNGLLPWLDLNSGTPTPLNTTIGLLDNANLAQSVAVTLGALDSASPVLTAAQQTTINTLKTKANLFLDNQAPGYKAFVDTDFGIFRQAFIRTTTTSLTGNFDNFIDRLASEPRGAVAFLAVRYTASPNNIPSTVFTKLVANTLNYTDRNGQVVENLAYYDGSAFQAFWPALRNDERDFIGFRNALDNALATFSDYSFVNNIPGFVSASQRPNGVAPGVYYGKTGIRAIAESGTLTPTQFLQDVGSTYALASAYSINPIYILNWLNSIEDNQPALMGSQGFFDSSRSNSEIAKRTLAVDVAATILGLSATGPAAFETYLKNSNLELNYNLLYNSISVGLNIDKASSTLPVPPEFPDRSKAVFSHVASEGSIGGYTANSTSVTGVTFTGGALAGGFGGQFWVLDQDYNATANQLVFNYNVTNTPQSIKIELKDGGDNLLYSTTANLISSTSDQRLVINLPNQATLATVRKVFLVIDQNATGDTSFDFRMNSIDFQHLPSSQNLQPNSSLNASNVTTLSGNPQGQFFSTNGGSLQTVSSTERRINYNVSNSGDFAGMSVNFDPSNTGASTDLSAVSSLVFGVNSSTVRTLRMEVQDTAGATAVFYIKNVDVTRQYYQFLTSLLVGSIDRTKVKKINFVVDQSSVISGGQTGSVDIALGGIS